ncbi:MAG: ABC transporter permease [Desulfuromonas sp.]|nr:MAG: ABC transporter permease [Desulfuromonas sp.]
MKLTGIAIRNLERRKARMAFLIVGLMVGVATVVALLSLTSAMSADIQHKMENYGANILLTPKSNDLSLSYGGISLGGVSVDTRELNQDDLPKIETIPNSRNISAVAPKVLGAVEVNGAQVLIMGVDEKVEFHLKRWWSIAGEPIGAPDQLVAGSLVAAKLQLHPSDNVEISGETFVVSGILTETGSQDDNLLLAPLATAQRLLGKEGKVSFVEVAALCADCPVDDMVRQISSVLPDVKVNAIQQVVKTRMHALGEFRNFSLAVSLVVLFVGSLVVFVTMMGSVNERCHEIGIFRALGFRKHHVVRLILTEAGIVSIIAGAAGFVFGTMAAKGVLPLLVENAHGVVWNFVLGGGSVLLAILLGALAAIYPALHASKLDPADALRTL